MRIISKADFDRIDDNYKCIFEDVFGKRPEWEGRRAAFLPGDGTALSIEGIHFLVDGDYSHLPVVNTANACKGACYQMAGGYIEVRDVYRISEEYAREHELLYLDRIDYIHYGKSGVTAGGCALPDGEIFRNKA